MAWFTSTRRKDGTSLYLNRGTERRIAFALAVLLPLLSVYITQQSSTLQSAPLAIHYIAMAIVAILGGLAPALIAVAISLGIHLYLLAASHTLLPWHSIETVRFAVMITMAVVISLMTAQRRRTSERLAEALVALKGQTAALVDAQQASKCAAWTYDSRDKTRWYSGGYPVFGLPLDELEALHSPVPLIMVEDQAMVREAIGRMVATRSSLLIEYRVLWPNGELHWSEARGTPLEGDPHVWRGVTFDITERKLAEAALIRSEKLAATGRLASTIAHEINNPLEAVTNLLYLARGDISLDPGTDKHLATAEKELARIGNITRLALGFVRTSERAVDSELADGVEDVLSIFRHRLEMRNILVDRTYHQGVAARIVPQELRQIAINLIANAVDAAPLADARIGIRILSEEGGSLLVVEDNGSGISESHMARVFEPFFSTKDDTGTGIGLWVTRELVEKNGGRIVVASGDLPGGWKTSFRVQFPACEIDLAQLPADTLSAAVS